MQPLDRRSRVALFGAAMCCYGAAATTLPQRAHGQAAAPVRTAARMASDPLPTRPPLVLPHRDPFAGGEASGDGDARPNGVAASSIAAPVPAVPLPPIRITPLPPNAGANGAIPGVPGLESARPVVHAIGLGPHPVALLQSDGADRLITVGDDVGGHRVRAITALGVRLDDDTLIALRADALVHAEPSPTATADPPSPVPSPEETK